MGIKDEEVGKGLDGKGSKWEWAFLGNAGGGKN